VLDGLKFSAGRAYSEFHGEDDKAPGAPSAKPKKKFEILEVK